MEVILLRPTIVIILGFTILIGISITAFYYLNISSEVLQDELMVIEKIVYSSNWEQALLRIEDLQTKWSDNKKWWAIFLNHSTLSDIEVSLSRLGQFVLTEDEALSLAELHTLLVYLKDIADSDLVRIYNIF